MNTTNSLSKWDTIKELDKFEEEEFEYWRHIFLMICIIPMSVLLLIESVQVYYERMQYFKNGWNLIDLF